MPATKQGGDSTAPTAAVITDAVLDEALSGHGTAGTAGKAITDINTNVDAKVSTRLAAASYTAERGTDNAMLAASYVTERGTDNAMLAASYVTERGTDNAALASVATETRLAELDAANIPADIDTLVGRVTATRATYLDELAAANLPTDVSNLDTKIDVLDANVDMLVASYSAEAGSNTTTVVCSALSGWGDNYFNPNSWWIHIVKADGAAPEGEWKKITAYTSTTGTFTTDVFSAAVAAADSIMLSKDEFIVRKNRTFFSVVDDSISLPAAAADTNLPDIVLPNIRGTITDVRVGIKIRMIENTSASGANALEGAQAIRIMKSGGSWGVDDVAAIDLSDNQWTVATSTREGGDVQIGDNDVASEVDVFNATYNLRFEDANVDYDYLQLNDVQVFAIVTYI